MPRTRRMPAMDAPSSDTPILSVLQARTKIREDFSTLVEGVIAAVALPPGHCWRQKAPFANTPEQALTWNMGCEIRSSEGGVSVMAGPAELSCTDPHQFSVEIRYHHPQIRIRDGRNTVVTSREGHDDHEASVWVNHGVRTEGRLKSLLARAATGATIDELVMAVSSIVADGLATAPGTLARVEMAEA